jgi:choline dehydrogenase-like flavoprotein
VAAPWPVPPAAFVEATARLAAEAFYGSPASGAWEMVGYSPGPSASAFPARDPPGPVGLADLDDAYDAVVVGAGAGGGVVACVLAEAGASVLLVEQGRWLGAGDEPRDHLRNHRLPLYGQTTGPDPAAHPRVFVGADGEERVVRPHDPAYHANAVTVGGGTRLYGAQAWRFFPDDFRMASRYGVPDGSSLADWPIGYDDLEPDYTRAEWEVGVAGDPSAHRCHGLEARPRSRGYPMPPVPPTTESAILAAAAARLGWSAGPVPLAVNTVPFAGRPACVRCGHCVGFACPSESKNGTHNTVIPRALATGRAVLLTEAQVTRVLVRGRAAVGVDVARDEGGRCAHRAVRAGQVVLCAGAVETARLLLASACGPFPDGLGNGSDQVGRHLQGHVYTGAVGRFDDVVQDGVGPGVAVATCQFVHGNDGVVGGGMLANEFVELPLLFWRRGLPPGAPRWGLDGKRMVRESYRRTSQVLGPVQEVPTPRARVTLSPSVADRFGMPVARLSGAIHVEDLRTAAALRARAEEWLAEAGATAVWSHPGRVQLNAGQHQAGTCRMGRDPASSVTDEWGAVHGVANLSVADASLHVTNGSVNPALTVLALAYRVAGHLAGRCRPQAGSLR